ncbi:MAG: hypothetical protein OEZ58_17700 [Gammaproteobacteria bacterium]|nr:hypothetical protein [Gammaproteobacteria bacterium]MDH5730827.1 hypothetical protein [Gammaproteobacteria bacterium]
MKAIYGLQLIFLIVCTLLFQSVFANDSQNFEKTIASIMLNINHSPSNKDIETLNNIITSKSPSKNIKTIIGALIKMNHKVSNSDRQQLLAISNDKTTPPHEKTLASVLAGLNHQPSSAAKSILNDMMH